MIVLVFVSEVLVSSLEAAIKTLGLTQLFTGVILIPLFGGIGRKNAPFFHFQVPSLSAYNLLLILPSQFGSPFQPCGRAVLIGFGGAVAGR